VKTDGLAVKTDGLAVKTDGLAVKTDGLAVKTDGLAMKTDGLAVKTDGLAVKTDGLAVKTDGLAVKTDGLAVKTDGLAVKTDGLAVKADGLAVKTDGLTLAVERSVQPVHKSDTTTTFGRMILDSLARVGGLRTGDNLHLDGPPVYETEEFQKLGAASSEAHLIQLHTAKVQALVQEASGSLCVINSERHAFMKDPGGGADRAPDMVVAHRVAVEDVPGGTRDLKLMGDGFRFGKLAHWCVRDMASCLWEWKKGFINTSCGPWGECGEYAIVWCSSARDAPGTVDRSRLNVVRIVLSDEWGFRLIVFNDSGYAERCTQLSWTEPGGRRCFVEFLREGLHDNTWISAVCECCGSLEVELESGGDAESPCFLGRGGYGRVFRGTRGGSTVAVKVAVGDRGVSALELESVKHERIPSALPVCRAVGDGVYVDTSRRWAALVSSPVGRDASPTVDGVKRVLASLWLWHKAGWLHGDARWANVVWVDGGPMWVDVRTAVVGSGLHGDVLSLRRSLHNGVDADASTRNQIADVVGRWVDTEDDQCLAVLVPLVFQESAA
jgi:hypothetical protein